MSRKSRELPPHLQRYILAGHNAIRRQPDGAQMSLRRAINDKCKDCIYDPQSGGGTWREQVAQCSCISCPLWPVRPFPQSSSPYANEPRKVEDVTPEWLKRPVGYLRMANPSDNQPNPVGEQG